MRTLLAVTLLAVASPAHPAVVGTSSNGFEVQYTVDLVVPPETTMSAFSNIGAWWDPKHTYSSDAGNLRLSLQPGGCFCERFPEGGGVEHMHVTYVDPGKRIVMTGSLGPLLYEATTGVMDVQVKPTAAGSQLTLDYKVAGFAGGGAAKMAPDVDSVLTEQLKRFRKFATSRPRT